MKRNIREIIVLSFVSLTLSSMLSSCWIDKKKPNYVYMPDMYYSEAYEAYSKAERYWDDRENSVQLFESHEKMTALIPVEGTIPRNESGILPTMLKGNLADYEKSKNITLTPLKTQNKEEDLEQGKYLFNIYCAVCHGEKGDGKGILVQNDKIKGVPNYKDRPYITVGSAHWVIEYGKGIMGSYASQLNEKERWQVAEYVMKLKEK